MKQFPLDLIFLGLFSLTTLLAISVDWRFIIPAYFCGLATFFLYIGRRLRESRAKRTRRLDP